MGAKIFVGNLHPRTTKSELARFFSVAGRVAGISIPLDQETGQSRGFCFVEFADQDSAEEALSLCEGRELDGHRLRLSWARGAGAVSAARRAKWRRDWDDSLEKEEIAEPEHGEPWRGGKGSGDYAEGRLQRARRHGKHGSDRKRRHGTRREID